VLAFAVVHEQGLLLFDTGVGINVPEIDEWYKPERHPLSGALRAHGLELSDVSAVANSHLHFDHCGQNLLFRNQPIHVQARELEAAREPAYTVPEWIDDSRCHYELLDGDAELFRGVTLVATPGHTPGHQSMVVDGETGARLIAGQAIYTVAEWSGDRAPKRSGEPSAWDPETYRRSVQRLRDLNPQRVYFSHDTDTWERDSSPGERRMPA
jgi:N-acyl homoserine lactone hydrolase